MYSFKNNSGQGLTEYLILLVVIAIASITAAKKFGDRVEGRLDKAGRAIVQHVNIE